MNLWGTQLVVLSACDTGRGDVRLGQGVYGLRRDLMTRYYGGLFHGHGRNQSMREAALAIRARRPHPYFWAPFLVIGRSGPLGKSAGR